MTDSSEIDMEAVTMVDAALAEGKCKAAIVQALSDALVGSLPDKSSRVLQDVVHDLFERLVERYSLDELREYWKERSPPLRGNYQTLPADDALAIDLLISIGSAMNLEVEVEVDHLLLGVFGVRGKAALKAGRTGGENTGKNKKEQAEVEHPKWETAAREMIATGTNPRDVTSKIAKRFGMSRTTIRAALQKAGVVPKRKETPVS